MIEELGAILQFLFIRDGVAVNDLVRTLIFLVFDGIVAVAAIITVKRTKHHEEGIEHGD